MITPFQFEEPLIRYTSHHSLGMFDKLYEVTSSLTNEQEDCLGEWLSINCTRNFIFCRITDSIIAGGSTNAKSDWERRNQHNNPFRTHSKYHIKLDERDIMLFEMVWLT